MLRKIIFVLFVSIFLISCAGRWVNTIPPGKTVEQNWEADEKYCRDESGKITGVLGGVLGATTLGLPNKVSGADERYNKCLEELGWMKYKKWFD